MKPLLEIADRHPISTGFVGIAGGALNWLLSALHASASVAGDVGKIASCVLTLLTLQLVYLKIRERRRATRHFEEGELREKPDEETFP